MTDHRAEISAQAEAYLEELRAAAAAAHERLKAGVMRLQPHTHVDESVPHVDFEDEPMPPPEHVDPIFATREFDVPHEALSGLIDFEVNEQ